MQIFVLNCGSSSIKAALFDMPRGRRLLDIRVEGIGESKSLLRISGAGLDIAVCDSHAAALQHIAAELDRHSSDIVAIGHRVVHGGEQFLEPTLITDELDAAVESLIPLAPLHNEACLQGIRASRKQFPNLPQVAVFDTAFHATLPEAARTYALPRKLAQDLGIRRFGFHGISHEYVAKQAADFLQASLADLKVVTCHLGNGSSLAAVKDGVSTETSTGMTPLEGLVMGTRSGDIDAGVLLHLLRHGKMTVDQLDDVLNKDSGLLGLCGVSSMQDVEANASAGDASARLAIAVFCHRLRKYIGAYAAIMGGIDVLVFTGGIGEHSVLIRRKTVQGLDFLGLRIDENRNGDVLLTPEAGVCDVTDERARVSTLVIATDEERAIAEYTERVLKTSVAASSDAGPAELTVPIATSARHVHLQATTIEALFGPDHQLTMAKALSQPGQFAAAECVGLVGPKGRIDDVRVLGPPRSKDQVEISRTDEIHLGLDAPVRASGDLEHTPGIILEGPNGRVRLNQGVICAWRHIHMPPEDATRWQVADGDLVSVTMGNEHRHMVFREVMVRVHPDFRLEMHIDTDEANSADLEASAMGRVVDIVHASASSPDTQVVR